MEKFAVDLDAVLDEFEFHEDQVNSDIKWDLTQSHLLFDPQAEKQSGRPRPSDTGFFSPTSEASPAPLISSLDPGLNNNIGASDLVKAPSPACLR